METGHLVEWSSEDNYLFKLTAFREQLLDWVNTQPYREFMNLKDYECLIYRFSIELLLELHSSLKTT